MKNKRLFCMSVASSMAALSILLDFVSVRTNASKFTLYGLPLLFAGMFFGPWVGGLAGLVSGFISQVILYGITPTTPIWMIAPMMWGWLSGFIYHKLFHRKLQIPSVVITIVCTSLVVTLCNTASMWLDGLIYHYPTPYVITQLFMRIITALILCIPYSFILYLCLVRYEKSTYR